MKKLILAVTCLLFIININAQTFVTPHSDDSRVITTGVPFLLITPDARAAAMGDMGVATSMDAFSQQWNPSKYAFSTDQQGVGVSYTPYLSKLVKDIFLGNLTYYNKLSERISSSSFAKFPKLAGIAPNNLLSNKLSFSRLLKFFNVSGILPEKSLLLK